MSYLVRASDLEPQIKMITENVMKTFDTMANQGVPFSRAEEIRLAVNTSAQLSVKAIVQAMNKAGIDIQFEDNSLEPHTTKGEIIFEDEDEEYDEEDLEGSDLEDSDFGRTDFPDDPEDDDDDHEYL